MITPLATPEPGGVGSLRALASRPSRLLVPMAAPFRLPLLALLLLASCATPQPRPAAPLLLELDSPGPQAVLRRAQELLAADDDPAQIQRALHSLQLLDPAASPQAPLLALRCCHWLADRRLSPTRLTNHNQVRPTNCLPLLKAARTQPQQDPAEIDYLELLLLGLKLERASVFEAAGTLPRFQKLAESLAATLPELDQGGPLRVLGMLHLRAPQWPAGPGDLDRALELLGAAASNYPAHPDNHLFLAEALLEDEDPEGAASALAAAQAAVPPTWPIWRQRRWQDGARTYHLSLPPPTPPPQP